MRHFQEDRRKLKELMLYVSAQCASKHNFGSVILYKILYFSDHLAFGKLGQPITGADYMKEKHGPIPRTVYTAREELQAEGRLEIREIKHGRGTLHKPVAMATPDMTQFTDEEIALVDSVIERFRNSSTRKVRRASHVLHAWKAYNISDTIPYETVYISPDQRLTRKEIEIGQEVARRRGWLRSAR
jgi:uncharacterized phage-associated protein